MLKLICTFWLCCVGVVFTVCFCNCTRWFVKRSNLGSHLLEAVRKRAGTFRKKIFGRWLDEPFVCHRLLRAYFNQSRQQTMWCSRRALPVEPVGKSVLSENVFSIRKSLQCCFFGLLLGNKAPSMWSHSCFSLYLHTLHVAASSSSYDAGSSA